MNAFKLAISSCTLVCITAPIATSAMAQEQAEQAPQIDYAGFAELTQEVAAYREGRLLEREAFFERASEEGALILDTRSAAAFEMGRIKGAVNLPFSDFTEDKLAQVIGDNPDRPIFIYCNNNFTDNVAPIRLKLLELALNIPTFINLYGYGYKNIWELAGAMPTAEVDWVGMTREELFSAGTQAQSDAQPASQRDAARAIHRP